MRIIWSQPALDDVRGIDDWLTREATPEFALQTLTSLRSRARFLQDFPRGGRPYRDTERVLGVLGTPYLIRYRVRDEVVEVIRVHHERENWQLEP